MSSYGQPELAYALCRSEAASGQLLDLPNPVDKRLPMDAQARRRRLPVSVLLEEACERPIELRIRASVVRK